MSNTTRYDSYLILHLSTELDALLHARAVRWTSFDRENAAFLIGFEDSTLHWSVRTGVPVLAGPQPTDSPLALPKRATIASVSALPDERILRIELGGGQRANAIRTFVVELLPVVRNVITLDAEQRVLKTLLPARADRRQTRGQFYIPPAERIRAGLDGLSESEWHQLFAKADASQWASIYIDSVAYASPINAIGVFSEGTALETAYRRYLDLRMAAGGAYRLTVPEGQVYPHALWQSAATPFPSLIAALAASSEGHELDIEQRLDREIQRIRKKISRLFSELEEGHSSALRLRANADLLMANLQHVRRGQSQVTLTGFDGQECTLDLDPASSAVDNAKAWYENARKREKAGERVPALIERAELQLAELERLLERARNGEAVELANAPTRIKRRPEETAALPYRSYRSSGGLEIRVGRSGNANDKLTFQHSSPGDVWLHAREVGGAHVILRWQADDNPPRADLIEAAILAAVHSKARHAGTVPVDWTRRKYVRKPRNAPPGQVRVERAQTLFVEPDASLAARLTHNQD